MKGYITTQEAAAELGILVRRIQALIQVGRLPAERIGTSPRAPYLIKIEDLEKVRIRKAGRPPGSASLKSRVKKKVKEHANAK